MREVASSLGGNGSGSSGSVDGAKPDVRGRGGLCRRRGRLGSCGPWARCRCHCVAAGRARRAVPRDSTDGVPAVVCLFLRRRRAFRVQHSYCFSLCSVLRPSRWTRLLPSCNRFRVVFGLVHLHGACGNPIGWSSLVNDLCPFKAPGAYGRGRPAREHGHLGTLDGIFHGGYSASPKWRKFCTEVTVGCFYERE